MRRRALTVQELACAHTHPTLQDPATTRIRARMYRSRYPTLRTVRITGSGEVWVDGQKRSMVYFPRSGLRLPDMLVGNWHATALRSVVSTFDAMEVVR